MIGTYVTKKLHTKFRIKCFLNGTSISKELLALIIADTKSISLENYTEFCKKISAKDEELKKVENEKAGPDSKT